MWPDNALIEAKEIPASILIPRLIPPRTSGQITSGRSPFFGWAEGKSDYDSALDSARACQQSRIFRRMLSQAEGARSMFPRRRPGGLCCSSLKRWMFATCASLLASMHERSTRYPVFGAEFGGVAGSCTKGGRPAILRCAPLKNWVRNSEY